MNWTMNKIKCRIKEKSLFLTRDAQSAATDPPPGTAVLLPTLSIKEDSFKSRRGLLSSFSIYLKW